MLLRLAPILAGVALATAACTDAGSFPANLEDADYDLEAMALVDGDLPAGLTIRDSQPPQRIANEDWAGAFAADETELELRTNQLAAQGRVDGFLTVFTWDTPIEHIGRAFQYTSHSTLYTDVETAKASIAKYCDLPIRDTQPFTEFPVPDLGDESVGFQASNEVDTFGTTVDTVVCFRTGRVVHAVVQTGLEGTSDRLVSMRLARKMLARVEAAFAEMARRGG